MCAPLKAKALANHNFFSECKTKLRLEVEFGFSSGGGEASSTGLVVLLCGGDVPSSPRSKAPCSTQLASTKLSHLNGKGPY